MTRKIIGFILGTIFLLALAKLFLAGRLSTTGVELAQIEQEKQKLQRENRLLTEEIIELSSLGHVASEAAKLGLAKGQERVNLKLEIPVALRGSH